MADFPPRLNRYQLREQLGEGAYGTVYRAELEGPLDFAEELAVKVLSPAAQARAPDALPALADEASILKQLRHPHIVQFRGFEVCSQPDGHWHLLALEFVRGVTLLDILRVARGTGRLVPLAGVLNFALEALEALEHAHDAVARDGSPMKMVHRDLKPANLMLDLHGRLRILDFGIAWALDRRVSTRVGVTKGSLPYMSPEQLLGGAVDGRSDLYVLGLIIFEMLCGEPWIQPPSRLRPVASVGEECVLTDWAAGRSRFAEAAARGGSRPLGRSDGKALSSLLSGLIQRERDGRFTSAADARDHLLRSSLRWDRREGHTLLATLAQRISKARSLPPEGDSQSTRPFPAASSGPGNVTHPGK